MSSRHGDKTSRESTKITGSGSLALGNAIERESIDHVDDKIQGESLMIRQLDDTLSRGQLSILKHVLYDACDVTRNRNIFEWIENLSKSQGHCILLYLSVRNKIKSHPLYSPSEFDQVLVSVLFFLIRVAEDCVACKHVNGFTRSPEVFSIFFEKIRKWLLPFESRIITCPHETNPGWLASFGFVQRSLDWPGLGEAYNSWPTVQRILTLLNQECAMRPVETHVKSHWAWCQYTNTEWVETIHFGDIPAEILDTFATNAQAAQTVRASMRSSLLSMLAKAESWESLWAFNAHAWVRSPELKHS